MSPRVLVFLAALVLPSSAFALNGRVVDAQGRPIAQATISILGRPGEAVTDADGRFDWRPDPTPPFEILVIDAAGTYARPVLVEQLDAGRELTVTIARLQESVTVTGSAPSIEATPAAGTTSVSGRDVAVRQPTNLMQAIENVAGVHQVSEGQAAVPAIRGLARGRTLILIDGARVSSERRVGPSATYMDPGIIEGVDVARGPGSVAYGSDAFGGVISVRTRSVAPGSPWAARLTGSLGAGIPERRGSLEVSKGTATGGFLIAGHTREAEDWHSPGGEVSNSGYSDHGVLARVERKIGPGHLRAGWQSDFGRDIERPRNNSQIVRFYYPTEDSHRLTANYEAHAVGGFRRVGVTGFMSSYSQVTDQDRYATATTGRMIERAEVSARDFHAKVFGEKLLGKSRLEMGVDVHGRFDLHAVDDLVAYDLAGNVVGTRPNVSLDTARRTDTGAYVSIDAALASRVTLGAGARADDVTTANERGHFGDRSTGNGAFSGFASATVDLGQGFSLTAQIARGFRDPVLSDRYYRGPTGRGFITGNPELEPETSVQGDLAVRYVAPRFRVAAYYYEYRIQHLIERYATATDSFFFRNRGTARIRGFELEGQADLGQGVTLELASQIASGRALDDEASLDDVSPANLSAVLRKQFGERGFGQVRVAYFGDDDHPGPTERAVPGTTLLDAAAGLRVARPLEIRFQARNLLDQEYYASQDVRAVLAAGRSASLIVAVQF